MRDNKKYIQIRYLILFTSTILLILLSGLRSIGVGIDDIEYNRNFKFARDGIQIKEIAFFIIAQSVSNLTQLFLIFAVIGVSLKTFYIRKNLEFWGFALFFYFSSYFILHEMVQIRAGIVSALGLWALYYAGKRNSSKFILVILIGLLFHYSILIFVPIYFFTSKKSRELYIGLLILSIILGQIGWFFPVFFRNILPMVLFRRIEFFLQSNADANLFNPIAISNYLICLFIFIYWDKFASYSEQSIFIIKTYIIGVCAFLIFKQYPNMGRLYELLLIVQIPLFDIFLKIVKPRWIVYLFVTIYSFIVIFIYLVHLTIITNYF